MADETERKRGYPYMSVNVWAELRRAFIKNVPNKVTSTYLQSVFKSSAKAAGNLLPQLKTVGLIDNDGVPLDLAKRYRIDAQYQDGVADILERVYPEELRGLFPGPEEDVQDVANWFMLDTGGGQIGATSQAKFYLMLVSGELPTAESRTPRAPRNGNGQKAKAPQQKTQKSAESKTAEAKAEDTAQRNIPPAPPVDTRAGEQGSGPALHIDIQIHIDAEATVDQIDAVFASMAKHIYRRD